MTVISCTVCCVSEEESVTVRPAAPAWRTVCPIRNNKLSFAMRDPRRQAEQRLAASNAIVSVVPSGGGTGSGMQGSPPAELEPERFEIVF